MNGVVAYTVSMTKTALLDQALTLPVEDQLDLAQSLWEHASPPEDSQLPQDLIDLLESRRQEAIENPDAGVPGDEVKARLEKGA
jgi:putative addiction module component (TIGR02574 family)